MTQIHLNARFLYTDHPTGAHRGAEALALAMTHSLKDRQSVTVWANRQWARTNVFLEQLGTDHAVRNIPADNPVMINLWEQLILPFSSRQGIVLNLQGTAPALFGCSRQVMLVNDCNSLIVPAAFSWQYRTWSKLAKYRAIRKARAVACISHYVKESLCRLLDLQKDEVEVVYLGPGLRALEENRVIAPRKGRNYFLCVGSVQKHKNIDGIVAAWKQAKMWESGIELVIVGKPRNNLPKSDVMSAQFQAPPGIRFTGFVSDSDLIDLYRKAIGVVFPSFHEGFGLPIVEAFFAGTPVITSNVSCLPEIAGDAAILVDPHSPLEIAQAMLKLAQSPELWATLVERGWKRKENFRWETAGRKLAEIVERAARNIV